jgi:hypothetical protein
MGKMKYALRIGILFAVTATLVMGLAVPALAKGKNDRDTKITPAVRTVEGKVVWIASDNLSFKIQKNASENITVSVNATTKYYVVPVGKVQQAFNNKIVQDDSEGNDNNEKEHPQSRSAELNESRIPANWRDNLNWLDKFLKKGQFSDIAIGDKVIARIGASDNVARQVLIIKAPAIVRVKGALSNVTGTSLTITPTNGPAIILNWDSNTSFTLKGLIAVADGKYATAVYNKNTLKALTVNVLPAAPTP